MCKQKWFWTWGTKSNNTIQIEIITNCSPNTIMILDSYYILMRDLVGEIWLELIDLWIYSYFSLICMTTFGINWDINESRPNKGLLSQKWLHLTGHFILQASFWMTFINSLIIITLFFFSNCWSFPFLQLILTNMNSCCNGPAETVIYRIFYYINRSGNGCLTLRELKRGNLIDAMHHADEEDDINKVIRSGCQQTL